MSFKFNGWRFENKTDTQSCCEDNNDLKKRVAALEAQSAAQQQQITGEFGILTKFY